MCGSVEGVGVCAGIVGEMVTLLRVWEEFGKTRVGMGDILFRALCHAGWEEPTVASVKEWMSYPWIDSDKKGATGESSLGCCGLGIPQCRPCAPRLWTSPYGSPLRLARLGRG